MQPRLEKITAAISSSIAVKRERTAYMDYPLHYHPEYEIIYVRKSHGLRLMGNHIGHFSDGDLVFIGKNLPHVWKNDEEYYQEHSALKVDVFVIHFLENALGEGFFELPEFTHVRKLFARGQQGLFIKGEVKRKISGLIKDVHDAEGVDRLVLFLQTLEALAATKEYELLSSPGYTNSILNSDTERINKVMNYCMENYYRELKLDDVAMLVNLNKSSFCRYFKSRTFKTFSQFLNEIRIANACKLLVDNSKTVSEICYECGYNNISHFNRQFKLIVGLTAKEYANKIAAS
ncbi:MAG: AraC family transcriptional regulator [Bacteroidota bacterium]